MLFGAPSLDNAFSLNGITRKTTVSAISDYSGTTTMSSFENPSELFEVSLSFSDGHLTISGPKEPFYCHIPDIPIYYPDENGVIESFTFYNCTSLTEVVFPDSVTSINNYAF